MKKSMNMSELGGEIKKFFKRFHVMLYTFTVLAGLVVAIFLLSQVLGMASDTSAASESTPPDHFDAATIDKVKSLNRADEGKDIKFPRGRINPFVE